MAFICLPLTGLPAVAVSLNFGKIKGNHEISKVQSLTQAKSSYAYSDWQCSNSITGKPCLTSKNPSICFGNSSHLYVRGGGFLQTARTRPGIRAEANEVKQAVPEEQKTAIEELVYKHILVPILDRNPYLSSATRQALEMTTKLARKYKSNITIVVIDVNEKEQIADHDTRIKTIRWHLSEGGFEEFGLLEKLGEGKMPAAVVGEVADDLNLDLVVLSMEAVHSKHLDANLLAEFVPCPVLMLPL